MNDSDNINHPSHYTAHPSGVECIQITEHFSFNIGNVIKYIWRADEKGAPLADLQKAKWYLGREIDRRIDEANTADLVTKSDWSADARRQFEMGKMCYHGDGMPQDKEQAVEWWTLAAAQGHAEAQSALDVYAPPSSSPPPAAEIDARLADIRGLATGGDRSAQLYLSDCYRHGWYGLLVSPEMSCLWRSRANEPRSEEADAVPVIPDPLAEMRARAEAGDWCAQCTLGDAYATGMEVAKDQAESDRWYVLASALRPTEDAQ